MAKHPLAEQMEQVIRTYIRACNDADAGAIAACFCPDAVHYFPCGDSRGRWIGAGTIGSGFASRVQEQGFCWTVDQLLTDVDRRGAVLEWTRFNRQRDRVVRGVDWFVFEPQTVRVQEIRPYSAAAAQSDIPRQELQDFDYAGRGYPTRFPIIG